MTTMTAAGGFPSTRWTLVLAAADRAQPEGKAALAALCEAYWYPLYAYVRRRGNNAEQAQDLTQDFFLRVLAGNYFDRADPARGHFRSFLLSSLKHFLADEWDRGRALKRGGGTPPLPFEVSSGEELYLREPAHEETPERIFERRWARSVLDRTLNRLREEFVGHGKAEHFNLKTAVRGGC